MIYFYHSLKLHKLRETDTSHKVGELVGQSVWYHTPTWWVTESKYLQLGTVIKQAKHTYQSGFFLEKEKRKIETPHER